MLHVFLKAVCVVSLVFFGASAMAMPITRVSDGVPRWDSQTNLYFDSWDSDGDGVTDDDEMRQGTYSDVADSDGDGYPDHPMYDERPTHNPDGDSDMDGDGLVARLERDVGTSDYDPDSDGDGLSDGDEIRFYNTKPTRIDSDDDSVSDLQEILDGTDPRHSPEDCTDADNDGLPLWQEIEFGTDPNVADSDSDGIDDGREVAFLTTNPCDTDTDKDGYPDGFECTAGSDPLAANSIPMPNN